MLRDLAADPSKASALAEEAKTFLALYEDEGEPIQRPAGALLVGVAVRTWTGTHFEYRRFLHPLSALAYAVRKAPEFGRWHFVDDTDDATGEVVRVTFVAEEDKRRTILLSMPPDVMKAARMVLGV